MKVKIQNLGAVKAAEIELKPLTVFVGENGTGKTWTAYTLASIFKRNVFKIYIQALIEGEIENPFPFLENCVDSIVVDQNSRIDILDFAKENLAIYLKSLSAFRLSWVGGFLSTAKSNFSDTVFNFELLDSDIGELVELLKSSSLKGSLTLSKKDDSKLSSNKDSGDRFIHFYSRYRGDILEKISRTAVRDVVFDSVLRLIHVGLFRDVFVLPTERSTLTSSFGSNIDKKESLSLSTGESNFLTQNLIGQFMLELKGFSKEDQAERISVIHTHKEVEKIFDLAKLLESEILLGSVDIDESHPSRLLMFEFEDGKSIELMAASSMVKELSSLVLYLRFFAKPSDLIVIDEPEMNLHPGAQVEIAEFLAMMVNAGLNLIITTHSPYIVDHLSNLIIAHGREDKAELTKKLYLENEDAFISPEKVSVYLFEDGTAKNILEDDGIIEWSTFSNVSDDIGNFL